MGATGSRCDGARRSRSARDEARRVLEYEHVLLHHLLHTKRDLVEIPPLDHQEHRHARIVATCPVQEGLCGSLTAFVTRGSSRQSGNRTKGPSLRARRHHWPWLERTTLCPRTLSSATIRRNVSPARRSCSGPRRDQDRKSGTIEHAAAGHRRCPVRETSSQGRTDAPTEQATSRTAHWRGRNGIPG